MCNKTLYYHNLWSALHDNNDDVKNELLWMPNYKCCVLHSPWVDLQFKGEGFQIFPNHPVSNEPIANILKHGPRFNMVIGMSTSNNVIVLYSFTQHSIRNLLLHSVFSTHTILKYWLGTATFNCTALYKNHRKVEFTQNWNKENTVDLFANLKYTISKTYTGCEMSINHWQIFVLLYTITTRIGYSSKHNIQHLYQMIIKIRCKLAK